METFIGIMIPFLGTTLGAACVFFMKRSLGSLVQRALAGFAAGVMVAASVWSLLIPAIEQSEKLGRFAFFPAFAGFWFGVLFLLALDHLIPHLHVGSEEAEGPKSRLDDGAGGDPAQYPGGHGSRCDVCRLSRRQRADHRGERAGPVPRHSHPEFPGGRHHLDAPARRRREQGQGLCRRFRAWLSQSAQW